MSHHTEPSSFRDRESLVYYSKGQVYRALKARAFDHFKKLSKSKLYAEIKPDIVKTREARVPPSMKGWQGVLYHEKIPFISYPYEWCFSQLKDSALLTLDLMQRSLKHGFLLKDASSFNVQFRGARPLFIDISSFERLESGGLWPGYRQYCEMFLYPLVLTGITGADFQPELKALLNGISADRLKKLLGGLRLFRPSLFFHVYLPARAQKKFARHSFLPAEQLDSVELSLAIMKSSVKRLAKVTRALRWRNIDSAWADYAQANTYSKGEQAAKEAFLKKVIQKKKLGLTFDLGCNTGHYSRILAKYSDFVIAIDSDHLAIERLYLKLKAEQNEKILPLVVNVADPSPARGFMSTERMAFFERETADLVLALALVHHLVIAENLPMGGVIKWMAIFSRAMVIEFVDRSDAMVNQLLKNRIDVFDDYNETSFRRSLAAVFRIVSEKKITESRTLFYCERKSRKTR